MSEKYITKRNNDWYTLFCDGPDHDAVYGVRRGGEFGELIIGKELIEFENGDISIRNRRFKQTTGLISLLFKREPTKYSTEDMSSYKMILLLSNAHKQLYEENGKINSNRSLKWHKWQISGFWGGRYQEWQVAGVAGGRGGRSGRCQEWQVSGRCQEWQVSGRCQEWQVAGVADGRSGRLKKWQVAGVAGGRSDRLQEWQVAGSRCSPHCSWRGKGGREGEREKEGDEYIWKTVKYTCEKKNADSGADELNVPSREAMPAA
ncbi:unnamed protein product [Phaedon cochleariae]|uniref:DUF8207 domain-containing protein n=1 Tax=Phaedon cochleariae TaxID=80249 RepID=A0A9N9SLM7_PHACE|nr:unnamed protein product [Phaedon cochleariae]